MVQAGSLVSLVVGASLVAVVTRMAFPPATWLALTFLLHASRSMPAAPGLAYVWVALYIALAIAASFRFHAGSAVLVAFITSTAAIPFAVDPIWLRIGSAASDDADLFMAFVATPVLVHAFRRERRGLNRHTQYSFCR